MKKLVITLFTLFLLVPTVYAYTYAPDSTQLEIGLDKSAPDTSLMQMSSVSKRDSIVGDTSLVLNPHIKGNIEELTQSFFYAHSQKNVERFDTAAFHQFINAPDSVVQARFDSLNLFTPFELVYNKQVKQYINYYTRKNPEFLVKLMGLSKYYFPMFEEYLDKYDLPFELKYLAVIESALNPTANSRAGAKGLWQFMYSTGKMYGLKANSITDDRFDPDKETDAACRHLKDLYHIYDNWSMALAAYNSGAGNVNKALRRAKGVKSYWAIWPFLPRETRGYVPAFTAVVYAMTFAEEMGIHTVETSVPFFQTDTVMVKEVLSFEQLNEFLGVPRDTLEFLNPTFKKGIIPSTASHPYAIRLPLEFIGPFIDKEKELYAYKTEKGIEKDKLKKEIAKAKERHIHIVRSGENLGLIAQRYHTSVRKIKAWNGLRSSRIYPGKRLVVYGGSSYSRKTGKKRNKSKPNKTYDGQYLYHTVRSGDTLWDIAKLYDGVSVKQIKRLNGIRNSHRLKPGQKIKISKKG